MNKLNRKVEYALIGLKHMRAKAPGELTTAKELANLFGCSFDVMSRVLQTLGKNGLVRSEQGAHGGYQLAKDLTRVSFSDLNEMILGRVSIAKCLHEEVGQEHSKSPVKSPCEIRGKCNIVSPVTTLNRKLMDFYQSLTLAEILDPRAASRAQAEKPASMTAAAVAAAALAKKVSVSEGIQDGQ